MTCILGPHNELIVTVRLADHGGNKGPRRRWIVGGVGTVDRLIWTVGNGETAKRAFNDEFGSRNRADINKIRTLCFYNFSFFFFGIPRGTKQLACLIGQQKTRGEWPTTSSLSHVNCNTYLPKVHVFIWYLKVFINSEKLKWDSQSIFIVLSTAIAICVIYRNILQYYFTMISAQLFSSPINMTHNTTHARQCLIKMRLCLASERF